MQKLMQQTSVWLVTSNDNERLDPSGRTRSIAQRRNSRPWFGASPNLLAQLWTPAQKKHTTQVTDSVSQFDEVTTVITMPGVLLLAAMVSYETECYAACAA